MAEIIGKALEKSRELRYQQASEMRADLRRLKQDSDSGHNFAATVGLGVEWAFADNWSARAEWDAILLPTQIFTVSGGAFGTDTITVNNRSINMFTAGVNYKFGGWW